MAEKLIKGSKEEFSVFLKNEDGSAFDLTPYTTGPGDVEVCIPISGGSIQLQLNGGGGGITVPTPTNGEIKASLTSTQTDTMAEGDYDVDIVLKETADPTNPTILKLTRSLSVEDRAC